MPGCQYCGGTTFNPEWEQAFGVTICNACRRHERLISKSIAKTTYLLTDSDLHKLGYLEKQNPQHKDWASMKMYLVSQVETAAVNKHGSLDAMEAAKQERAHKRIEERAKRRQEEELAAKRQKQLQKTPAATVQKHSSFQRKTQQGVEAIAVGPLVCHSNKQNAVAQT
eukprot:GHRR01026005.1.p1 GENE.GHRR01026005.1~~GHRR01026005.1.p1  ORF type:complete len:168 (+),score=43.02 GHRR01026005.1:253-756(+)